MKITIKQLKQLIREAAYQGPDAKTVLTVPYSTETAKRDVQVSRIEYEIHPQKRSSGWIYIDLLESGNSDNLNRTQFRDLFSSLGFDRSAFNDIQFSAGKFKGLGNVYVVPVGHVFSKAWYSLFGHETVIDL
jgi:hypothetical protein